MAGRKRPAKFVPNPAMRMPAVDARAHTLLAPAGRGMGLNGPMRLVALLLMLWDADTVKGRIEWDHDQIADRTGLSVAQVADALDKLRQVHLVQETAAGPKLSWDKFASVTLPQWRAQSLEWRPTPSVALPQATPRGERDDHDQVAQDAGDGDGGHRPGADRAVREGGTQAQAGDGAGGGDGRTARGDPARA